MPKSLTPPGLEKYRELERQTKRERPTQRVGCAMDIGTFVATIRRGLHIRQSTSPPAPRSAATG